MLLLFVLLLIDYKFQCFFFIKVYLFIVETEKFFFLYILREVVYVILVLFSFHFLRK